MQKGIKANQRKNVLLLEPPTESIRVGIRFMFELP